jgi:hypothetical protein
MHMKYFSDDRGILPIVSAMIVAVLLIVVSVAVVNARRSHSNVTVSPTRSPLAGVSATPIPTPTAGTQEALIYSAVKADCKAHGYDAVTLKGVRFEGEAAIASINCSLEPTGGFAAVLKKVSGQWAVVYTGQQPPGADIGIKYGLPADMYDASRK